MVVNQSRSVDNGPAQRPASSPRPPLLFDELRPSAQASPLPLQHCSIVFRRKSRDEGRGQRKTIRGHVRIAPRPRDDLSYRGISFTSALPCRCTTGARYAYAALSCYCNADVRCTVRFLPPDRQKISTRVCTPYVYIRVTYRSQPRHTAKHRAFSFLRFASVTTINHRSAAQDKKYRAIGTWKLLFFGISRVAPTIYIGEIPIMKK